MMDEKATDDIADDDLGIRCPSCGCRHCPEQKTEVERTIALGKHRSIRRVRICQHCSRRFQTFEKVVGDAASVED